MSKLDRTDLVEPQLLGEQVFYEGRWWKVVSSEHGWLTLHRPKRSSIKEYLKTVSGRLFHEKKVRPDQVF